MAKTLCDIVEKVSERVKTRPNPEDPSKQLVSPYFRSFVTNKYKMFCFKSMTNLFFLVSTKIDSGFNQDFSTILKNFYMNVYLENVSLNPLFNREHFIVQSSFKLKTLNFFQKFIL